MSGKRYERQTMTASRAGGVLRPGAGKSAVVDAPRSGRVPSPRPKPASNIRPSKRIPGGGQRKVGKAVDKIADNLNSMGQSLKRARGLSNSIDRMSARDALRPSRLDREIARQGGMMAPARRVIQRRQQRAFSVQNGRNPQIGSKALFVYQAQLRQLGTPSNQRQSFRRKPMTSKQAARAKVSREKADMKRLDTALKADLKQQMNAMAAARKAKAKPKRKKKQG